MSQFKFPITESQKRYLKLSGSLHKHILDVTSHLDDHDIPKLLEDLDISLHEFEFIMYGSRNMTLKEISAFFEYFGKELEFSIKNI